ncbi:porin [Burkholderia sp. Bp8998]|uniref:porin n=1 Tax=Burkholderia sp. Bp8998 TaxID=2184557 RepID=UPI000F5948D7|nr:porin [Burkholderia sp. Bp8998]RQS21363.1 porin [Burkholderia sp. Bp8998]
MAARTVDGRKGRHTRKIARAAAISAGLVGLTCAPVGVAYAQSSVTLYGVMDVGLQYRTAAGVSNGKAASAVLLASGNELTSRWGLLGFEDIGGGYKATFKIESGFSPTTGNGNFAVPFPNDTNALFDRGAVIGVVAPWGKVLMGRNWSPFFDGISAGDATGFMNFGSLANAVFQNSSNVNPKLGLAGIASGANSPVNGGLLYTWVNNSVKYMLPDNTYGLSGGVLYSFGGTAGSFANKQTWSANLNWTNGTLGLTSAYFDARDPTGATSNPWLRALSVGVSYVIGPVKTGFDFAKFRNPTTGANQNYYYLGAAWQASPFLRATADWMYLQDLQNSAAGAQLFKVGAQYSLSKRTTLYTDIAYSMNKVQGMLGAGSDTILLSSPATIGHNQIAITAGIRTLF